MVPLHHVGCVVSEVSSSGQPHASVQVQETVSALAAAMPVTINQAAMTVRQMYPRDPIVLTPLLRVEQ